MSNNYPQTLCWCCARATGFCRWSAYLRPVPGWKAEPTKKNTAESSFMVYECPQFVRDAVRNGAKRYDPNDPLLGGIRSYDGDDK